MSERLDLNEKLDGETFRSYYYLKKELVDFCRDNNLPVSGGKVELTDRIACFLDTGKVLETSVKRKTTIDKQFEYNTYIRDFFEDNQGRSLDEAITCWKYKKSLQGHNRYEKSDLVVLD